MNWVRLFPWVSILVSGVILCVALLGHFGGWLDAGADLTLYWTAFAWAIVNLIWVFGRNRLLAALAARAAAKHG